MKELTLQIEDEHYDIMEHFAKLYGQPVEEYVLMAAKGAISANIAAELDGEDKVVCEFEIHKRLGGDDKG